MPTFKVICKANPEFWKKIPAITRIVSSSKLFGLLKSTKTITEEIKVHGPAKEEICIVTDEYVSSSVKYYVIAGYPYGGYDAKNFVRLDEFTETQKEIAKKHDKIMN